MIIFLYGEDSFRSRQKLNELKEKFLREIDPSGNSLTVLNGETADMSRISESIGAGSLIAKKRMVVIESIFLNNSQSFLPQVRQYLKDKKF